MPCFCGQSCEWRLGMSPHWTPPRHRSYVAGFVKRQTTVFEQQQRTTRVHAPIRGHVPCQPAGMDGPIDLMRAAVPILRDGLNGPRCLPGSCLFVECADLLSIASSCSPGSSPAERHGPVARALGFVFDTGCSPAPRVVFTIAFGRGGRSPRRSLAPPVTYAATGLRAARHVKREPTPGLATGGPPSKRPSRFRFSASPSTPPGSDGPWPPPPSSSVWDYPRSGVRTAP